MKALLVLLYSLVLTRSRLYPRPALSLGWRSAVEDRVSDDQEVTFLVTLKSKNMDKVHAMVARVSDPMSPAYTQYMTTADIAKLTLPASKDRQIVERWLKAGDMRCEVDHNISQSGFESSHPPSPAGQARSERRSGLFPPISN